MGQGPAGKLGSVGRPVLCPHPRYWLPVSQCKRRRIQTQTSTQAASRPGAGWGKDGVQIQTSLSRSVSGAWCKAGLPADAPREGS